MKPAVSVVSATHNRVERLAALLDALRAQTLGRDRFEVVIVDDASSDGTRALLERLGGFDEATFSRPGGEDTDLAWRAIGGGVPTAFSEDARVWHAVHELGALERLRFATRWDETMAVFARYPELRRLTLIRG